MDFSFLFIRFQNSLTWNVSVRCFVVRVWAASIGQQCFRCETAWTSSVCGAHTSNPSSCVALGIGGGSSSWLYLAPWQLDIVTSWWMWAVVLYSLLRSMLSGQGDVVTSCTETLTTESALNAFLETQSVWLALLCWDFSLIKLNLFYHSNFWCFCIKLFWVATTVVACCISIRGLKLVWFC